MVLDNLEFLLAGACLGNVLSMLIIYAMYKIAIRRL